MIHRIERVVVPVDFSPESERAVMVAAALADRLGAGVEMVTVVEPSYHHGANVEMIRMVRTVARSSCKVIATDQPTAEVLLREVQHHVGDLWCVGTHGRGGLGSLVLGSVSETLVREAHAPVVLVGPHVDHVPGGDVIAVALDESPRSEAILPAIEPLREALGMSVRLLEVAAPIGTPVPADMIETAYVARVAARELRGRQAVLDYDVLHGEHPAVALAAYVDAHAEIGMLALATRGLAGRDRLLHGSVAFEAAHKARVPVLVDHVDA